MKLFARILILASLLVGVAAVSGHAQQRADAERVKQRLIGSYKLISYTSFDEKGVATKLPYSVGQISYDAANRMSAQLVRDDRPTTAPRTEAERAAAYAGIISYFGRYEIDAEKSIVTHHVEGAISPTMVGQGMPRHYELTPDNATLFLSVKNGERVTGRLQWDRYK